MYYFTISKYTINSFIIKVFLAGVEESYIISHDQFSKFIFDILYRYCVKIEYENDKGKLVDSDENCGDENY